MHFPKPFAIALFCFAAPFFSSLPGVISAHPNSTTSAINYRSGITTKKIWEDLVRTRKTLPGIPWAATNKDHINWIFESTDTKEFPKPLTEQADNAGDIYITLFIRTKKSARINNGTWKLLSGEIILRYVRKPGDWFLERVRNRNSKYQLFSSTDEELPGILLTRSYSLSAGEYGSEPFRLASPAIVLASFNITGGSKDVWIYVSRNKQRIYEYNTKQKAGNGIIQFDLDAGAYDIELDNRHSVSTDKYVSISLKAVYK